MDAEANAMKAKASPLRRQASLTQRALDWRVRAAFSGVFLAQANPVKIVSSHPSRQQVTPAVGRTFENRSALRVDQADITEQGIY